MIGAGVTNPVLVFEEVDKVSDTPSGRKIIDVLMRIVDPVQNMVFSDAYLSGVPIDLSKALVIFTCNDPSCINPILLDRVRRIPFAAMCAADRHDVVRHHIIPRLCGEYDGRVGCSSTSSSAVQRLLEGTEQIWGRHGKVAGVCAGIGVREVEKVAERVMMQVNLRALDESCVAELSMQDVERTLEELSQEYNAISCLDCNDPPPTMYM
jgi:ATP-dependent Lon protease